MYYTYMLRCKDNSIYTGITNDLNKRMEEHFSKDKKGAKYTKSHDVLKVEAVWSSKDKPLASKLEYRIKKLSKTEKESLIQGAKLSQYFEGKIDGRRYRKLNANKFLDEKFLGGLIWKKL